MNLIKLFLVGCIAFLSIKSNAQCSDDYELFWSDEFELTEVDLSKWVVKNQGGGFGNQELQYYQPQNATVSDGFLHIKLANETVVDGATTYDYTSAKLETASKVNFSYGKMEARIKMPDALGAWPAFWMLGSNIGDVGWPHCGEIDIMEWVARGPNEINGSMFFDGTWPNNHISTPYFPPAGQSFITDYHTFAVEWEPNEIRYYCDDNHYATYRNSSIAPKEWVFNHDFFLILNCAIGGSGGGPNINIVGTPYMEVDYVRVYSLPATAGAIEVSGPTSRMANSQNVLYSTTYFPNTTYDWTLPNGATIVDGTGTNEIHVNFGTESGDVSVTATNTCATLTDAVSVELLTDACTIIYDNFEDERKVTYEATGILTENFTNPLPDLVNTSTTVGKYERSIEETYDVLSVHDIALESALDYENGTNVFFMDILTSAAIGTQITLQLENKALSSAAYPQGRRSSYTATISKQNEWHTLQFAHKEIISTGTLADQVDRVALLFDPSHKTGDIYYFDNFKRLEGTSECPAIPTGIKDAASDQLISIYPNPVTDVLFLNTKIANQHVSIYNHLGKKVMETTENKIDVSQLSSGIYILKSEGATLKFVKQ